MSTEIIIPLTVRYQLTLGDGELKVSKQPLQHSTNTTSVCAHTTTALEYWKNIGLLPVSIEQIVNELVYCRFQDNCVERLNLQPSTLLVSNQQNNRAVVEISYVLEHCTGSDWLMLYCRSCGVIFQLYQL